MSEFVKVTLVPKDIEAPPEEAWLNLDRVLWIIPSAPYERKKYNHVSGRAVVTPDSATRVILDGGDVKELFVAETMQDLIPGIKSDRP
jgi:hypothetical protein